MKKLHVALLALACGPAAFDPISKIESVRVLAMSADKPYAHPGDTVNVTLDTYDGRPPATDGGQNDALVVYRLPLVCEDPPSDLYYACFVSLVTPQGSTGGAAGAFPANVDISDLLQKGPQTTFTMPADAITNHAVTPGLPEQYGLVFLFAMACAGRVRTLPIDPSAGNGQTVPLGCFDSQGNQLGPDSYVFTYMRVYAYENATNANPVINGVLFDGQPVDLNAGVVIPHCDQAGGSTASGSRIPDPNATGPCAPHDMSVTVPDSSWEQTTNLPPEPDGTILHEEIWADYYYTLDNTRDDGELIFDARTGRVPNSDNAYLAPTTPGQGRLFIVLHDSRAGASWVDFPIVVQ